MAQSSEDDMNRRPRRPADLMAGKLDAFRSEALQELARDMLILSTVPGQAAVVGSLLRVLLGRQVEVRQFTEVEAALASVASQPPKLVLLSDDVSRKIRAADVLVRLQAAYAGPVIVLCDHLTARDAVQLREAGPIDVISKDDLDSVRLSQALLRVAKQGERTPAAIRVAWLMGPVRNSRSCMV